MTMPHQNPSKTKAWQELVHHAERLQSTTIRTLHDEKPEVIEALKTKTPFGVLDFHYQLIDEATLHSLEALTDQCQLNEAKKQLWSGTIVNETEQRPALHVALRTESCNPKVDGQPIQDLVHAVKTQMSDFVSMIHEGKTVGSTGKVFTDIIHLGIGGSDLGPRSIINALRFQHKHYLRFHSISNVDAHAFIEATRNFNPETTLVIIASKTFTTQETLLNAKLAKEWLTKTLSDISTHFVALTSDTKAAIDFGVPKNHIFGLWDWVGGRFSLWSSIGLPIALVYGFDVFDQILDGAQQADLDFFDNESNAATILALMSIWNTQFLHKDTEAAIAYDERLSLFPNYLQQLRMESNGKSIDRDNKPVNYPTNPLLITGIGTDAQHAFFQQFHQGTTKTAFEFYAITKPSHSFLEQHQVLLSNVAAQREALAYGDAQTEHAYQEVPGNHPSCLWMMNELTPKSLGYLYATQEHRTFVQGHLLNINSFDQYGVELGKRLARTIQNRK